MKGKLLSKEEILKLKEGDKVWVDYDIERGCFDEVLRGGGIERIEDDCFVDKFDDCCYIDTMINWLEADEIKIYQWIEETNLNNTPLTDNETQFLADNMLNKYINHTYKGSEILAMIEDGRLKDDDIIVTNTKTEIEVSLIKDGVFTSSYLIKSAPFTIKPKPVDFMTAVNSGLPFTVDHKHLSFVQVAIELAEFFSIVSENGLGENKIKEILNCNKFYLEY